MKQDAIDDKIKERCKACKKYNACKRISTDQEAIQ